LIQVKQKLPILINVGTTELSGMVLATLVGSAISLVFCVFDTLK
jgi:hypothetical protein